VPRGVQRGMQLQPALAAQLHQQRSQPTVRSARRRAEDPS
jgi:hypothetical protein